jgi:FixJ family two-component response regulator
MSNTIPRVFIVDDDAAFSKSLARLVKSIGFDVETFVSAEEFLQGKLYRGPCCLLLDVRMPGLTGPDLQKELAKRNISMPIIFLTGHGDVPTGIKAMKNGAEDFLLKPVEEGPLFEAIDKALDKDVEVKKQLKENKRITHLITSLTPREHEVFRWIITGMLNKQIAYDIGITERTVKAHRSQIMKKLNVFSVAELVRLAQKVGISPAKESPNL